MGVTSVNECFSRGYDIDITGAENCVRNYLIRTDSVYTNLDTLVTDAVGAGLPAVGDQYNASADTVLFKHVVREIEKENFLFYIECVYKPDKLSYASPADRPWLISFDNLLQDYVPDKTQFSTNSIFPNSANPKIFGTDAGDSITNQAEYPFDPTVTDFRSLVRINMQKYFTDINSIGGSTVTNIASLMAFSNTVNSSAVTIAGITGSEYMFWMEAINIEKRKESGQEIYDTTFSVIYDPDFHCLKLLNAGWIDANGKTIRGDVVGEEITSPWPLDETGMPIRGGVAIRRTESNYLAFGIKFPADFGDLALPTTF